MTAAQATCTRCGGAGWYSYDENHSKPCEECCPHDQGVWLLQEHYGDRNGMWCCKAGCGAVWAGIVDYQNARKPHDIYPKRGPDGTRVDVELKPDIHTWVHSRKGRITGELIRKDDEWMWVRLSGDHHLRYMSESARGRVDPDGQVICLHRSLMTLQS